MTRQPAADVRSYAAAGHLPTAAYRNLMWFREPSRCSVTLRTGMVRLARPARVVPAFGECIPRNNCVDATPTHRPGDALMPCAGRLRSGQAAAEVLNRGRAVSGAGERVPPAA